MNTAQDQEQLSPEKKAVALTYHETLNAPVVLAKGRGEVAEKIVETAKKHGIETYFDEQLLDTLMAVAVGEEIPTELYTIVAKILLFVEKIDALQKKDKRSSL